MPTSIHGNEKTVFFYKLIIMKKIVNILSLACLSCMAACSSDNDEYGMVNEDDTRTIVVRSDFTRTSIDYEGSDYSHLVWNENDQIAYVTDCQGDAFQESVVKGNEFSAEIPKGATSENHLLALWPVAENPGKEVSSAKAELKSSITQRVDAPFDGNLLPMYAYMNIPNGQVVNAQYRMLASVLRFSINPGELHKGEILKSVILTTNEPTTGAYNITREADRLNWMFNGTSTEVQTVLEGEPEALQMNETGHEVYMVVNRGKYTGVNVKVETDAAVYEFKDGKMEVDQEGRTLYRIQLNLDNSSEVPEQPAEKYFIPIADVSEISPEGTYLIVTDDTKAEYFMLGDEASSEIDYLAPLEVTKTEEGILLDEVTQDRSWKIEKDGEAYTLFSNHHQKYIRAPQGISYRVYGHVWMENSLEGFNYDCVHFNIQVGAEGTDIALRHVDAKLQYFTNSSSKMFCFCKPDATDNGKVQNIVIYKLQE